MIKKILFLSFLFLAFNVFPKVSFAQGDIYDIILFFGQSNMVGFSNEYLYIDVPKSAAYEYMYGENELRMIDGSTKNFGETLKYDNVTHKLKYVSLSDTSIKTSKGTNMIPQFVKVYYELTGHKVIVVFAAKGSQQIANFLPNDTILEMSLSDKNIVKDQFLYEAIVEKYNKAVEVTKSYINVLNKDLDDNNKNSIGKKFYIVFQGEDDVLLLQNNKNGYSSSDYYERFMMVHNNLKKDCDIEFGGVVEVGSRIGANRYNGLVEVNVAQEMIINNNDDIFLGSAFPFNNYVPDREHYNGQDNYNNALKLAKSYMVADNIHFNAKTLSLIGEECARNAVSYLYNNYNWLTSIKVNDKEILVDNVYNYDLFISNSLDNITIDASLLGNNLEFEDGYGPRGVSLKKGINEVILKIRNKNDNTIKSYVINIVKDDKDNLENYSNNVLDYDDIDDNNNYVSDDESTVNVESNNDSISNVNTNNMNLDSRNETKKEKKLFFPKIILAVSYILILVGLIAIFVVKKLKNKK